MLTINLCWPVRGQGQSARSHRASPILTFSKPLICLKMYNPRQYHIADDLKVAFIDYILEHFGQDVIIGHEMMYGSNERFADLVFLYKGYTYAVEVKSDSDSLNRINDQLDAYQKLFNYVIVVCGQKYKQHLKSNLPDGVGLFEVANERIVRRIKRPRRITSKLDKQEMILSIRASYLAQKADFPVARKSAFSIREQYCKKRTSYIQEILYDYWYAKLRPAYETFLSNRGVQTLPNDLANFSTLRVNPIV